MQIRTFVSTTNSPPASNIPLANSAASASLVSFETQTPNSRRAAAMRFSPLTFPLWGESARAKNSSASWPEGAS